MLNNIKLRYLVIMVVFLKTLIGLYFINSQTVVIVELTRLLESAGTLPFTISGEEAINIGWVYGLTFYRLLVVFYGLLNQLGLSLEQTYLFLLLSCDLLCFSLLCRLKQVSATTVFIWYYISPLIILPTFGLGANDILVATLLILSIICLKMNKKFFSAVSLSFCIALKLTSVIFLPFFLLFFIKNENSKRSFIFFLLVVFFGIFFLEFSFLFNSNFITFLQSHPVAKDVFGLSFRLGDYPVFFFPFFYIFLLFIAFGIKIFKVDMLGVFLALTSVISIISYPQGLGWICWLLPVFLCSKLKKGFGQRAAFLTCALTLFYVTWFLRVHEVEWSTNELFNAAFSELSLTFYVTTLLSVGVFLMIDSIMSSRIEKFFNEPYLISIAGDSGVGKDFLSAGLVRVLGKTFCCSVSGDNYHRWDRHKPMWQILTHLNPLSNNLDDLVRHIAALKAWETIETVSYDHTRGVMTRSSKVRPKRFLLSSGLHALLPEKLRTLSALKIYIDMDAKLKFYFKCRRDVLHRGYEASEVSKKIESRKPDFQRWVSPQKELADLVFVLSAVRDLEIDSGISPNDIAFEVIVTTPLPIIDLQRVLVAYCGLSVDISEHVKGNAEMQQIIAIQGEVFGGDLNLAIRSLFPQIDDWFSKKISFEDSQLGLMEFFVLVYIAYSIRNSGA